MRGVAASDIPSPPLPPRSFSRHSIASLFFPLSLLPQSLFNRSFSSFHSASPVRPSQLPLPSSAMKVSQLGVLLGLVVFAILALCSLTFTLHTSSISAIEELSARIGRLERTLTADKGRDGSSKGVKKTSRLDKLSSGSSSGLEMEPLSLSQLQSVVKNLLGQFDQATKAAEKRAVAAPLPAAAVAISQTQAACEPAVQYSSFCQERVRSAESYDSGRYLDFAGGQALALEIATKAGVFIKQAPARCDLDFAAKQLSFFHAHYLHGEVPAEGPLLCQEDDFLLDHLALISPNPDKTFLEVGANKGYDLVEIYDRWTNFTRNMVWQRVGKKLHPGCPYYADVDRAVFPKVFAFEPMAATMQALERLQATLPLCNLQLFPFAVSGPASPSTATFVASSPGDEMAHILWTGERVENYAKEHTRTVRVVTLDNFVEEHHITHVHGLFVDTEGNDPKVLAGAEKLIAEQRVDLIVMEYGGGMEDESGAKMTLERYTSWMDGKGFETYYIGPKNSLVQLSGAGCWNPDYETKQTSNILSVRRNFELASALVLPFLVGGNGKR